MISTFQELTTKEKGLFVLILLFFITLYFAHLSGINAVVTGALVVYSFTMGTLKDKKRVLQQRPYLQWMLLFFLALVVSTLLSDDIGRGLHHLKIRLPLLLFPASIGMLELRKSFKDNVLLMFACITTLVAVLCIATSIYSSTTLHRPDYMYNDALTSITRQQSIYVALAINIAIFIFAKVIFFGKSNYKGTMTLAVIVLFAFSYLLASRVMFALLLVTTLSFSFYYIIRYRKILEGATLVLGLFMGIIAINKLMPSTFNRYKELTYQSFDFESRGKESHYNMEITPDQWNGANFRLAAWTCGLEVFQSSPVKGVDLGDKEAVLLEKYKEKKFYMAIETEKNVHSNYLDILFSTGMIGFIMFLTGWLLLPFFSAYKNQNVLAIIIILTFAAAWVTEVYFGKNLGTMLVGFFIPFLLTESYKKETAQQ
ncbi:O-antigen ligase family protein [Rufibacter sediminis]|uniref:O-antigen ligase family protein n=1 Tax=Rufibacter sediminis TaxID=2762756 RepID=A0ABR6VNG2_9BACT|nr:O-antigen ligase family protein [Rufibacter sediminis]MBC3538724.1 O-antigen ligase family protein [Rufibacter sediminis]